MKRLCLIALTITLFAGLLTPVPAQNTPTPAASISATPTPTPAPQPTPIPLADVITQADAAEASLQEMQPATASAAGVVVGRDLPAVTREISAQLAETTQLLKPGVLLETLRDIEARWEKLNEQLGLWSRDLTNRANLIDKQLALLPDLQSTWTKTREAAQSSETPPEIRQRIDNVLAEIGQTEDALQKRRAAILTQQSRVAEQTKRVTGALASIRAAQNAAVSQLFVRDSRADLEPGSAEQRGPRPCRGQPEFLQRAIPPAPRLPRAELAAVHLPRSHFWRPRDRTFLGQTPGREMDG